MGSYRLSVKCISDLEEIAEFSVARFGAARAQEYREELLTAFETLGENPGLGVAAEWLRPGTRRQPVGSHVIYYEAEASGVFVLRILHGRMDMKSKLLAD